MEFDAFGPWYCPNMDEYSLMNSNGLGLFMTVQSCQNAIGMLKKGNATTDCEENVDDYIHGMVQANTKFVSQYFNIEVY